MSRFVYVEKPQLKFFVAVSAILIDQFIHYLTRKFRIKLHAKTDTACTYREAMRAISVFKCNVTQNSRVRQWIFLESHNWIKIRRKENSNNIVCFYPKRAPQKAISKSTVRTVIALANRKRGQSCTLESSTTLFVPRACFYICFQTF